MSKLLASEQGSYLESPKTDFNVHYTPYDIWMR